MDLALESGINFFDTADVYGAAGHRGRTEEILGRWFATGGERRERTVPATKLYGTTGGPAQRVEAFRAEHPARPGREAEAAANGLRQTWSRGPK